MDTRYGVAGKRGDLGVQGIRLVEGRLSPESTPIEIADLPEERDEETLLYAMGSEAANVHLGSKRQIADILRDLGRRKSNWLRAAGSCQEF
jgi:hypothetical protein